MGEHERLGETNEMVVGGQPQSLGLVTFVATLLTAAAAPTMSAIEEPIAANMLASIRRPEAARVTTSQVGPAPAAVVEELASVGVG